MSNFMRIKLFDEADNEIGFVHIDRNVENFDEVDTLKFTDGETGLRYVARRKVKADPRESKSLHYDPNCDVAISAHSGIYWADRNTGLTCCSGHKGMYDEHVAEFGPYDWVSLENL